MQTTKKRMRIFEAQIIETSYTMKNEKDLRNGKVHFFSSEQVLISSLLIDLTACLDPLFIMCSIFTPIKFIIKTRIALTKTRLHSKLITTPSSTKKLPIVWIMRYVCLHFLKFLRTTFASFAGSSETLYLFWLEALPIEVSMRKKSISKEVKQMLYKKSDMAESCSQLVGCLYCSVSDIHPNTRKVAMRCMYLEMVKAEEQFLWLCLKIWMRLKMYRQSSYLAPLSVIFCTGGLSAWILSWNSWIYASLGSSDLRRFLSEQSPINLMTSIMMARKYRRELQGWEVCFQLRRKVSEQKQITVTKRNLRKWIWIAREMDFWKDLKGWRKAWCCWRGLQSYWLWVQPE